MKTTAVLALIIPLATVGFYLLMDDRQLNDSDLHSGSADMPPASSPSPVNAVKPLPRVEDMLGKLEARLESDPDDASGWNLLGKSYEYLGRPDAAEKAFNRARALGYSDDATSVNTGRRIKVIASIEPSLVDAVSMTDTVFVFARAVNGPRIPLATLRKQASELPFEFELDDSMAVSPFAKLSDYEKIIIGVRVSRSGETFAREGDLEGFSGLVSPGAADVVPVIVSQAVIR
ncbi:MAG: hypothetical protein OEY45_00085 [Gammaproteobacteria bacterium]|nr:hypothetical protein [Gammaproteobacteria bacterium]MDH5513540.1 hypothetical protein [Gammaproteobacteria bacterium]